jgi:hypothetical protein
MASANVLIWDTRGSIDSPAAILTLTKNLISPNTWSSDTPGVLAADSGTWTSITLGTSDAVRVILSDAAGQVASMDGAKSPVDGGTSGEGMTLRDGGTIGSDSAGVFAWSLKLGT